ncbi:hypothetical protein Y032_0072g681 [Ancylostoma ceylanicum]|uniref:Uncharacterized protein n=1 Tax=Ancylostoma ceylanicum TaxID=53326 RepID=A0A016TWF8_9BILA|nr:hypothetical protein Y032_0072g681 [Ancylostoma ceylanicum]
MILENAEDVQIWGRGSLCAPHVEDDVLPSAARRFAWRSFHTSASAAHSYKSKTVSAVIYRRTEVDSREDADAEVDTDVHSSDGDSSSSGDRDGNMEFPSVLDVQVQLRPIHAWPA